MILRSVFLLGCCVSGVAQSFTPATAAGAWPAKEADYVARNFRFGSGETLPEVRIHYRTVGSPHRDAAGNIDNAVLILHGTGGSGANFLTPQFAGELCGAGQPLDASRYFIILPDNVGHGKSSRPSDGLRMKFPKYDYDDMVRLQHALVTDGLHVQHLRLIIGTSMGCMHAFVWGEMYPGEARALMPLACLPTQIAGRNREMRYMTMENIMRDPAWQQGNYTAEPELGLRTADELLFVMSSSPLQLQKAAPTREAAEKYIDGFLERADSRTDANDFLYYINASRNYDPSAKLSTITVPVMFINSADDFINPPELGIAEKLTPLMPRAKFVLLPITDQTRGHGTHSLPAIWKSHLVELLAESELQK